MFLKICKKEGVHKGLSYRNLEVKHKSGLKNVQKRIQEIMESAQEKYILWLEKNGKNYSLFATLHDDSCQGQQKTAKMT